jgi:hypothetical protein
MADPVRNINSGRGKGRPSGEAFDPWDTGKGSEYRPDRFYTRSTNEHDHSEQVRNLRIPPNIFNRLAIIITDKRIPQLRSMQDVVRDALVHRSMFYSEYLDDPDLKQAVTMEMMVCQAEFHQQEIEASKRLVSEWEDSFRKAVEERDAKRLRIMLDQIEFYIEQLEEPYAGQMQGIFDMYLERTRVLEGQGKEG